MAPLRLLVRVALGPRRAVLALLVAAAMLTAIVVTGGYYAAYLEVQREAQLLAKAVSGRLVVIYYGVEAAPGLSVEVQQRLLERLGVAETLRQLSALAARLGELQGVVMAFNIYVYVLSLAPGQVETSPPGTTVAATLICIDRPESIEYGLLPAPISIVEGRLPRKPGEVLAQKRELGEATITTPQGTIIIRYPELGPGTRLVLRTHAGEEWVDVGVEVTGVYEALAGPLSASGAIALLAPCSLVEHLLRLDPQATIPYMTVVVAEEGADPGSLVKEIIEEAGQLGVRLHRAATAIEPGAVVVVETLAKRIATARAEKAASLQAGELLATTALALLPATLGVLVAHQRRSLAPLHYQAGHTPLTATLAAQAPILAGVAAGLGIQPLTAQMLWSLLQPLILPTPTHSTPSPAAHHYAAIAAGVALGLIYTYTVLRREAG